MLEAWVWLGFFGGAFQAFRVAGQRLISVSSDGQISSPSMWASPFSRVLLGVPVSAVILLISLQGSDIDVTVWVSALGTSFFLWIGAAALLQLLATIVQTSLVKRRNFAVGVVYLKIMIPAQAIFGVMLFHERFNVWQWTALVVVTFGVLLLGRARVSSKGAMEACPFDWTSLWMGLGAGIVLAFTGLFIRQANLALSLDSLGPVGQGMTSLLVLATMQLIICSVAISLRDRSEFVDLLKRYRLVAFTGLMSVGGSSCWFVGFALASPALVNAIGQSEFFFAIFLSLFLFREQPSLGEWIGAGVVLTGILMLLLSGTN